MPDQAPKIEPGAKGRLRYDKERQTIVGDQPAIGFDPGLPGHNEHQVVGCQCRYCVNAYFRKERKLDQIR